MLTPRCDHSVVAGSNLYGLMRPRGTVVKTRNVMAAGALSLKRTLMPAVVIEETMEEEESELVMSMSSRSLPVG